MTDNPLPGRRYSEAVYIFAAEQLQRCESTHLVQSMLVAKGLDEESAADVVAQVCAATTQVTDSARRQDMTAGGCMFVFGILVTAGTAIAASGPGGGVVIIASGAIIYGAIHFFRALWRDHS